jgi:regulator of RNase E activity RraA
MTTRDLPSRFEHLSTPLLADAVIRLGLPPQIAPGGIRSLIAGSRICGPAAPVVLTGYADCVLEGIYRARPGDVLVLDNKGREDEACFGDLAAYEARSQGLAGVVIWGRHRDSAEVAGIGVPLFSYGAYPLGLQRTYEPLSDPFARCEFGPSVIHTGDLVFADDDGALFVPAAEGERVVSAAEELAAAEKAQVERIRAGITLREQLKFDDYLRERLRDPTLTLGEHMKRIGRHF